jgi:DNA-directed RNA polymerase subunit K/omega
VLSKNSPYKRPAGKASIEVDSVTEASDTLYYMRVRVSGARARAMNAVFSALLLLKNGSKKAAFGG